MIKTAVKWKRCIPDWSTADSAKLLGLKDFVFIVCFFNNWKFWRNNIRIQWCINSVLAIISVGYKNWSDFSALTDYK